MSHHYPIYTQRETRMIDSVDFVPRWMHTTLNWVSSLFAGSVVIQAAMTPATFQAWGAAIIAVLVMAFNGFLLCYNRWARREAIKARAEEIREIKAVIASDNGKS